MNLDEYQLKATETAIYKVKVADLLGQASFDWFDLDAVLYAKLGSLMRMWYVGLGLAGEICELIAIVDNGTLDVESITAELGDASWYCAAIAQELEMPLSEVARHGVLPPQGMAGARLLTRLIKQYGAVANTLKRLLRDENGKPSKESKEKLVKAVGSMVATVNILSKYYEVGFDAVLSTNLSKLASRAERGALTGSGDKR